MIKEEDLPIKECPKCGNKDDIIREGYIGKWIMERMDGRFDPDMNPGDCFNHHNMARTPPDKERIHCLDCGYKEEIK